MERLAVPVAFELDLVHLHVVLGTRKTWLRLHWTNLSQLQREKPGYRKRERNRTSGHSITFLLTSLALSFVLKAASVLPRETGLPLLEEGTLFLRNLPNKRLIFQDWGTPCYHVTYWYNAEQDSLIFSSF